MYCMSAFIENMVRELCRPDVPTILGRREMRWSTDRNRDDRRYVLGMMVIYSQFNYFIIKVTVFGEL
jgi:hypothetical protein